MSHSEEEPVEGMPFVLGLHALRHRRYLICPFITAEHPQTISVLAMQSHQAVTRVRVLLLAYRLCLPKQWVL